MENKKEEDYNIEPEDNVPQKVYGVPDFLNKQKTKYIYEFIPYEKNWKKYIIIMKRNH